MARGLRSDTASRAAGTARMGGLWVWAAWLALGAGVHAELLQSLVWWMLTGFWCVALGRVRGRGAITMAGGALVAICLAAMTPAGANALVRHIEMPLGPAPCVADPDRVHVLLGGGALHVPLDARDFSGLTEPSLMRATRWQRQFAGDTRPLVISGGGGDGGHAEARSMAVLIGLMGRPASLTRWEIESNTTEQNARAVRRQLTAANPRIVLSTSALHQRRASFLFRAQGFEVCDNPLASEYLPPGGAWGYYWPQTSSLRKAERALHEWGGLAWAVLKSRLPSAWAP